MVWWRRPETFFPFVVVLALLIGPAFAFPSGETVEYVVIGVSAEDVVARGDQLIDDYTGFVTARLSPEQAQRYADEQISVIVQNHSVGRGAVRFIPPESSSSTEPSSRFVVQFRGPVKSEWRSALDDVAHVYDYLPHHAFLVKAGAGGPESLTKLPGVRAVFPYSPGFKLSPELPTAGPVDATVLAYPDAIPESVVSSLEELNAEVSAFVSTPLEHVFDIAVDASALMYIATLQDVAWVEPSYDEGSLDNEQASAITQGGAPDAWPIHEKGVDGSSQAVSVCDTGANTRVISSSEPPSRLIKLTHEIHDDKDGTGLVTYNGHLVAPEFPALPHRKVDLYYSPQESGNRGDMRDPNGHGTHTSGTLAGDAPPYGVRNGQDGIAFASRLLVCDITDGNALQFLNDYANYWDPAYQRGARVNSNSWGSAPTNAYTEKARQHDAYMWTHRDFVIVRSMGNAGPSGAMRPEAAAKNVLSVGATLNGRDASVLSPTSTWGPTEDGRVKPNVVAPGRCLVSSFLPASDSYACLSGTSMSTPVVAGSAALVRDYFEKGFYPSGRAAPADHRSPSSALVRAILQIAGRELSDDGMQTGFPNRAQGWGRVTLEDALYFDGDAHGLVVLDEDRALATGDVFETEIQVGAGKPLRIMLAWTDAPAAAGSSVALVNNLDLEVKGPGGPVYHGTAVIEGPRPPHPGARDDLNVEEGVYIFDPHPGTYKVRAVGRNIPGGAQPFAMVAVGEVRPA